LTATTWSYQSGSQVLNVSTTNFLVPGLLIIINGAKYMITGVYDSLGTKCYVTVSGTIDGGPAYLPTLASDAVGTTYTGTGIGQQPLAIIQFGSQQLFQIQTPAMLDAVSNIYCAYGLRKLRSAYAGQCVKVRRSSDNTTQDIGFVNGELDQASFNAFIGAGTGYVDTWYDQGTSAYNLTQATTANQPQLIMSGINGLPSTLWNGTNQVLIKTGMTASGTTLSADAVAQIQYPKPYDQTNYVWSLWNGASQGPSFSCFGISAHGVYFALDQYNNNNADGLPMFFGFYHPSLAVSTPTQFFRVNEHVVSRVPEYSINGMTELRVGQKMAGMIGEVVLVSAYTWPDRAVANNMRAYWNV
jgi:hypothetical protein